MSPTMVEVVAAVSNEEVPRAVSPNQSPVGGEALAAEDPQPEMSTRERIRARLRAQEARLGSLVRSTSGDGTNGTIFTQMKNVEANLKQMESEKGQLEEELNRLKTATDGDDFLKEKMTGIQEGFEKQLKKIQSLEDEVLAKNSEIESYQVELLRKLHRIVELEFDLETHEVHYTSYAAEQFRLGEEALLEIKDREKKVGKAEKDKSTRRSQKLISKLLSDLDNLEARYKDEKLAGSIGGKTVALENTELLAKVTVLERRLDETGHKHEEVSVSLSDEDFESVLYLRKRVESLEAKRFLHRNEMDKLQGEVTQSHKDADSHAKRANNEIDRLRLQSDALKARILTLENGLDKKKKRKDEDNAIEFRRVEKTIRENYSYLSKLEASLDIRDRQLATLKRDLGQLKMKEISRGKTEGHTEFDTDLVRNSSTVRCAKSPFDDDQSGLTEPTDSSFVRQLQVELRIAQQELVKKDQELVIERAKAASTAAGLLGRITQLTAGINPSSSPRKEVPRRDSRRMKY